MKTAEEVLKSISELSNGEKQNLLNAMYDKYFDGGGAVRHIVKEDNKDEILKVAKSLEQDIEFLSKKIGKFDMYFNRLNSQSFSTDRELEIAFLVDKLNMLEREVFLLKQKEDNEDY